MVSILLDNPFIPDFFQKRIRSKTLKPASKEAERLSCLAALQIGSVQRILVCAPHPDDETLGAGGLIQAARENGSDVQVVFLTNGDGQQIAPFALQFRLAPRKRDYIAHGERRQAEALAALDTLGVDKHQVYFLGYPDRRLQVMWQAGLRDTIPVTAVATRFQQSPYRLTFNPGARYRGADLLGDLRSILQSFRPEGIILPHPKDLHPDHQAANLFTRLAIRLESMRGPGYQPHTYTYLIHYPHYPQAHGKLPGTILPPPADLCGEQHDWRRLDLNLQQVALKHSAIQKYKSQILLLGGFLQEFARTNEIFARN